MNTSIKKLTEQREFDIQDLRIAYNKCYSIFRAEYDKAEQNFDMTEMRRLHREINSELDHYVQEIEKVGDTYKKLIELLK